MAKQTRLTTGYYRYTDIVWEWHKALPNPDDLSPLKALISPETLMHPDHPLRKPDQEGLELFIGMFENGETRLLFSSAQIEYVRYYLHAMKLTTEPIPLPSSGYLIKRGDLKSCAPEYYTTHAMLKNSIKRIDKTNKRLKSLGGDSHGKLTLRRMDFERVRSYWASRLGTWLAIDFESWERDHLLLLEVGWSLIRWDADGNEVEEQTHLIIKERMQYQNSQYVAGNRDHYNFGQSEQVGKNEIKTRIRTVIEEARERGPLFLVFHDHKQDVKDLTSEQMAGPLPGLSARLPDEVPTTGMYIVDTVDLFAALEGTSSGNKRSLEQTCRQLQVMPVENLHNAGNDAHYTMLAARAMAEGGQLDAQRRERWPTYTSANGLGADLPGFDGNPDIDELEGPNTHNLINEPAIEQGDMEMEEA